MKGICIYFLYFIKNVDYIKIRNINFYSIHLLILYWIVIKSSFLLAISINLSSIFFKSVVSNVNVPKSIS